MTALIDHTATTLSLYTEQQEREEER